MTGADLLLALVFILLGIAAASAFVVGVKVGSS